jgi:hypothetical protein
VITVPSVEATDLTDDGGIPFVVERMRVVVVAGMPVGVLVAGVGSRLAMLVLRLTSPEHVRGVTSDDGFTIGQVTVGGTYNLLLLGSVVGVIGAGAYMLVAPRLIGPAWFRRLTVGAACAAVVGSMLVHADGIDFTLLQPTWLAIGLFVALPGLFGVLVGPAVDAARRPDSWSARGRRRWLLPIVVVACFPPSVFSLLVAAVVLVLSMVARQARPIQLVRRSPAYMFAVRAVWLLIAIAGLVALVNDIDAII